MASYDTPQFEWYTYILIFFFFEKNVEINLHLIISVFIQPDTYNIFIIVEKRVKEYVQNENADY